ncbi:MAG: glycoside hydrolase family 3 C-terminal domain-containing protein [Gemmatimonadetes bacterium]|nr:glycoside hydrolase family 3 C-terminal domain-containing protein [Gemmatimonadota bacterium]
MRGLQQSGGSREESILVLTNTLTFVRRVGAAAVGFSLLATGLVGVATGLEGAVARPAAAQAIPGADTLPYLDPRLPLEARVSDLLGRMTLEEKAGQMQHQAPAIPRLGIPAYNWWSEALHGVARAGRATVFPQAIGLAATWDTNLMRHVADVISLEARAKYEASVAEASREMNEGLTFFSPNINIFRDPRWGRGQETYGEDPYLTGRLAVAYIEGMQGDDPRYFRTVATAKHFAVHSGPEPIRHQFDAVVSARDMQETYLPAFKAAMTQGGAYSIMCSYNRVYGDPSCASDFLLADVLRRQWDFRGYVVSDCWALTDFFHGHDVVPDETHAAARALQAGTDLTCGPEYRRLPEAVRLGLVTEARVDTAVARLLRARFLLGMFDPPEMVPWAHVDTAIVDSPAHRTLARKAARESIVLLKDEGGLLPLRGVRRLAVIGPNANDVELLLGNYNGWPAAPVTPLEGMRRAAQARGVQVTYARGSDVAEGVPSTELVPASALEDLRGHYFATHDFSGSEVSVRKEATLDHTWFRQAPMPGVPADSFSVRWTGTLVAPATGRYALGAQVNGAVKVFLDDSLVVDFSDRYVVATHTGWVDLQAGSRHKLEVEYHDRRIDAQVHLVWSPPAPHLLDDAVAAARNADAAVMFLGLSPRLEGEEMPVEVPGFSGGDRVTLDLPAPQRELLQAVTATGKPVVLVLLSGSAVALPWGADHVPAIIEAWYGGQAAGDAIADVLFGDVSPAGRLPVTVYRSVDQLPPFSDYDMSGRTYRYFRGDPLFPFGHGLSYSTFHYENLEVVPRVHADEALSVSVEVENAGTMPADEVVQAYLADTNAPVPVPVRSLVGFERVSLAPGERRRVTFQIAPDAFSVIDPAGHRVVEPGIFELSVGGKQPGQHGLGDASTTDVLTARVEVVR